MEQIVASNPGILNELSEKDIANAFWEFCSMSLSCGRLVTVKEFDWIGQYVEDLGILKEMQKNVFITYLLASFYADKERYDFDWMLSEKEKGEIARLVLQKFNFRLERKIEIAKEFGEPFEKFEEEYFQELLLNERYEEAKELGVKNDDAVLRVVAANIEAGLFDFATKITRCFLSHREDIEDLLEEINAIKEKLKKPKK